MPAGALRLARFMRVAASTLGRKALDLASQRPQKLEDRRREVKSVMLKTLKRMLLHPAATAELLRQVVAGIANQTDVINRKLEEVIGDVANQTDVINRKLGEVIPGIANQTDVINRKLEQVIAGIANQTKVINRRVLIGAGGDVAEHRSSNPGEETDEVESALAVIRESADSEAAAAKIFDWVLNELVAPQHRSISWGDRLLTLDKTAGFNKDPQFRHLLQQIDPKKGCNQYASPDRLSWRLHTVLWAATLARHVPGDFVECGTSRGDMPWIISETPEFERSGKTFYVYDSFAGFDPRYSSEMDFPEVPQLWHQLHEESGSDPHLYEKVVKRFSAKPNVKIIKGVVPDVLRNVAPTSISFLHLDMNAPLAERLAVEYLYDRLSPGAVVLYDDYGWVQYRRIKEAADEVLGARGQNVLELPTGQGLAVIQKPT
jgi:O-methyltransferase